MSGSYGGYHSGNGQNLSNRYTTANVGEPIRVSAGTTGQNTAGDYTSSRIG